MNITQYYKRRKKMFQVKMVGKIYFEFTDHEHNDTHFHIVQKVFDHTFKKK